MFNISAHLDIEWQNLTKRSLLDIVFDLLCFPFVFFVIFFCVSRGGLSVNGKTTTLHVLSLQLVVTLVQRMLITIS